MVAYGAPVSLQLPRGHSGGRREGGMVDSLRFAGVLLINGNRHVLSKNASDYQWDDELTQPSS